MKPRRFSLRVQMAWQYAAVTLLTGGVFVAVNFGAVERNTAGLTDALVGLGVITLVAVAAGWGIARYTLRPVRAVTAKAKQVSAASLHQRIGLEGPNDELQQLATTFDELLARLEASFERERRFVANASHELRTPLAVTRTTLELGLNSPQPTVESLRDVITQALAATSRSETLAADLLVLARTESVAVDRCDHFDLGELVGEVVNDLVAKGEATGLEVSMDLASAPMWGNASLVDRLIANLVDNAVRYNTPGGWIEVSTRAHNDHARLVVRNSARSMEHDPIEELFEPFHRGRTATASTGHGLGLSIVRAIAASHGARLSADRDETDNAFRVEVSFAPERSSPLPDEPVRPLPLSHPTASAGVAQLGTP